MATDQRRSGRKDQKGNAGSRRESSATDALFPCVLRRDDGCATLDRQSLVEWAAQLAANHQAVLPARVTTAAHIGDILATSLGTYLSGTMDRATFRDVCGWSIVMLRAAELSR